MDRQKQLEERAKAEAVRSSHTDEGMGSIEHIIVSTITVLTKCVLGEHCSPSDMKRHA